MVACFDSIKRNLLDQGFFQGIEELKLMLVEKPIADPIITGVGDGTGVKIDRPLDNLQPLHMGMAMHGDIPRWQRKTQWVVR